MENSDIGNRMKRYESVSKLQLMNRTPVIIRIDGKAFHTFTRGMVKPFDDVLIGAMQDTMKYLCENIQGCVFGYTQSDEISLLLIDYQKLDSSSWFDNEVQKLCSVSASMATCAFNVAFLKRAAAWSNSHPEPFEKAPDIESGDDEAYEQYRTYVHKINRAMFDSRCFNIPKEEVTNYFLWRQMDATRNSINAMGFAHLGSRKMQNKSCAEVKEMLLNEKNIDWLAMEGKYKWGSCCVKSKANDEARRTDDEAGWVIDNDIPRFLKEGREYIDRYVFVGEQ